MNVDRIWTTACQFGCAGYCFTKGIETAQIYLTAHSSATFFKVGAIQSTIALLVAASAIKIFNAMGWQPSNGRAFTVGVLTYISSTVLTAALAIRLGLVGSSETVLITQLITAQFSMAAFCMALGIENLFCGTNHRPVRIDF